MGAIYKLVEIEGGDHKPRFTAKRSPDKHTLAGAKQLFRYPEYDLLGLHDECACGAEAMLKPYIIGGNLIHPLPPLDAIRDRAKAGLAKWPLANRTTRLSLALQEVNERPE
jgi:hypothetical protein